MRRTIYSEHYTSDYINRIVWNKIKYDVDISNDEYTIIDVFQYNKLDDNQLTYTYHISHENLSELDFHKAIKDRDHLYSIPELPCPCVMNYHVRFSAYKNSIKHYIWFTSNTSVRIE